MSHRIRMTETGGPSVLRYETYDVGAPGPNQVRIRQHAIGVNFVDTLFRSGVFNVPLPFTPGVEAAGVVEAVGPGVSSLKVGDRVAYWFSLGAYADERLVDAEALIPLSDDVAFEAVAAILAKGLTAWALLKKVRATKAGETVLVTGASGGVGSLLSAWARALGATVIAVVGSPAKASDLQGRLGLDHILLADDPDLVAKVKALTGGHGVDAVYELVGAETFAASTAALKDGGDLVHLGNASGAPQVDQSALTGRGIRYVQPVTGKFVPDRETFLVASAEVLQALRDKVFGPIEITRYPLADAGRAHEDIGARRLVGSAVLIA